jgi:hypothetical protein
MAGAYWTRPRCKRRAARSHSRPEPLLWPRGKGFGCEAHSVGFGSVRFIDRRSWILCVVSRAYWSGGRPSDPGARKFVEGHGTGAMFILSASNRRPKYLELSARAPHRGPRRGSCDGDCFVVFEARGHYVAILRKALERADIAFSRANPEQVRHFAKAIGCLAKTGTVDARMAEPCQHRSGRCPHDGTRTSSRAHDQARERPVREELVLLHKRRDRPRQQEKVRLRECAHFSMSARFSGTPPGSIAEIEAEVAASSPRRRPSARRTSACAAYRLYAPPSPRQSSRSCSNSAVGSPSLWRRPSTPQRYSQRNAASRKAGHACTGATRRPPSPPREATPASRKKYRALWDAGQPTNSPSSPQARSC